MTELEHWLTSSVRKRRFYEADVDFRVALDSLTALFAPVDKRHFLSSHALTFLKPDAFAYGVAGEYLTLLGNLGFQITAWRRVKLSRARMRLMWKYQWNIATLDRIFTHTRLNQASDIIALSVKLDSKLSTLSAAETLSTLKGSGDPSKRKPGTIRSQLKCPNVFFSAVHVSDDPADIVRELGVLFDEETLSDFILNAIEAKPNMLALEKAISTIESGLGRHEFDLPRSAIALKAITGETLSFPHINRQISNLAVGKPVQKVDNWRGYIGDLGLKYDPIAIWDEIAVASALVKPDLENRTKLL